MANGIVLGGKLKFRKNVMLVFKLHKLNRQNKALLLTLVSKLCAVLSKSAASKICGISSAGRALVFQTRGE